MANKAYQLTFYYSHNVFSAPAGASGQVQLTGASSLLSDIVSHASGTSSNLNWRPFLAKFTADSTTTSLTFTNLTGTQNGGLFLDAVSIAAVPEASTWAMMILGIGLAGFGLRRRSSLRTRAAIA